MSSSRSGKRERAVADGVAALATYVIVGAWAAGTIGLVGWLASTYPLWQVAVVAGAWSAVFALTARRIHRR